MVSEFINFLQFLTFHWYCADFQTLANHHSLLRCWKVVTGLWNMIQTSLHLYFSRNICVMIPAKRTKNAVFVCTLFFYVCVCVCVFCLFLPVITQVWTKRCKTSDLFLSSRKQKTKMRNQMMFINDAENYCVLLFPVVIIIKHAHFHAKLSNLLRICMV